MVVEPAFKPCTSALQILDNNLIAVRCWGLNPGTLLFFRIFSICIGIFVIQDSVIALLRICPPPSP